MVYLYPQTSYLPFRPVIERFPRRLFSFPLRTPVPDIIRITVADIDEKYLGENAEWWILAETPKGWLHYDMLAKTWKRGAETSYQGNIYKMKDETLSMEGLPVGKHTLYFGLDLEMDYKLGKAVLFDSVLMNIDKY